RPCSDDGEHLLVDVSLYPSPHDPHVLQIEVLDDHGQPLHAAFHRFDEHDLRLRTQQRDGNARQTGTAADVADDIVIADELGDHGTVEDVSGPQTIDLTDRKSTRLNSSHVSTSY